MLDLSLSTTSPTSKKLWNLGSAKVTVLRTHWPAYESPDYKIKKELEFTFAEPRKEGSRVLAGLFIILLVGPWFPLLGYWSTLLSLHFSLKSFLFLASLLAWVGLLVAYWIKLNVFQFLEIASGLSLLSIVTGWFALREKANKALDC